MSKLGRPSKYKKRYCKELEDYFRNAPLYLEEERITQNTKTGEVKTQIVRKPAKCPTFIQFADKIGVNPDTLLSWAERDDFSVSYKKAKAFQADWLMNAAGMGFYNPAVAIMALKSNHGWTDRVDSTGTLEVSEMPSVEVDGQELQFKVGDDV